MIRTTRTRTTISPFTLLGGLLLVSTLLLESSAAERALEAPRPARKEAFIPQSTADVAVVSVSLDSAATQERLSPEMARLGDKVRRALRVHYDRPLNSREFGAWSIMHSMVGYGVDTQLNVGGLEPKTASAVGWLCWNGTCAGDRLLYLDGGRPRARQGAGLQGHAGQFLAILAQSKVQASYPMKVAGKDFSVADLVESEKLTCESGTELTFKLIGLVHYLKSDETWDDQYGQRWSLPRLIKEELAQPVIGAACGGTHRMMGFGYAVQTRQKRGEPMTGQWLRAKTFVDDYHEYAFRLQNEDGSFSTDWFAGRGDSGEDEWRLETTGHVLEWLVYSLPEEELRRPPTMKAVDYVATLLLQNPDRRWGMGPLGHAIHALVLYDERVLGAEPGQRRLLHGDEAERDEPTKNDTPDPDLRVL